MKLERYIFQFSRAALDFLSKPHPFTGLMPTANTKSETRRNTRMPRGTRANATNRNVCVRVGVIPPSRSIRHGNFRLVTAFALQLLPSQRVHFMNPITEEIAPENLILVR